MNKIGNMFLLGDSYSTFEGYMPEGHLTWYSNHYEDEANPPTDVRDVKQTWWHQLVDETEANLLLNSSYSGTTICHTTYDGADGSDRSFVTRVDKLIEDNYFTQNQIDTCIVFGGTNDSWADSPLGEIKYSDWEKKDLYFVFPAFCYLLHRLKESLPKTRILVVINTELKQDLTEGFEVICDRYGVEKIKLQNIDKINGHPSIVGMRQIKDQIKGY